MSTAYFQSPLIGLSRSIVDGGESLVKRCLIAIEGTHVCNKGKKYEMPADFMRDLGDNLNAEISLGRIIPFFRDHKKSAESEFGKLQGFVECRPVVESDLPTPEARGMLGKMALFGNVNITHHLDLVRSGAIKALSPGIDIARKLIHEISSVPVASMPGVTLFSYAEVKEQRSQYSELRMKAIESLDTLIESFIQLDRTESEIATGGDMTQKLEWFNDCVADLREIFELPEVEDGEDSMGNVTYSRNPYDREVIKQAGFSMKLDPAEKDAVLDRVADIIDVKPTFEPYKSNILSSRRGKKLAASNAGRGRGG
jgi:hypothetical protein